MIASEIERGCCNSDDTKVRAEKREMRNELEYKQKCPHPQPPTPPPSVGKARFE